MRTQAYIQILQKPKNTVIKMNSIIFIIDERHTVYDTQTYKSKTKEYVEDSYKDTIECEQSYTTKKVECPTEPCEPCAGSACNNGQSLCYTTRYPDGINSVVFGINDWNESAPTGTEPSTVYTIQNSCKKTEINIEKAATGYIPLLNEYSYSFQFNLNGSTKTYDISTCDCEITNLDTSLISVRNIGDGSLSALAKNESKVFRIIYDRDLTTPPTQVSGNNINNAYPIIVNDKIDLQSFTDTESYCVPKYTIKLVNCRKIQRPTVISPSKYPYRNIPDYLPGWDCDDVEGDLSTNLIIRFGDQPDDQKVNWKVWWGNSQNNGTWESTGARPGFKNPPRKIGGQGDNYSVWEHLPLGITATPIPTGSTADSWKGTGKWKGPATYENSQSRPNSVAHGLWLSSSGDNLGCGQFERSDVSYQRVNGNCERVSNTITNSFYAQTDKIAAFKFVKGWCGDLGGRQKERAFALRNLLDPQTRLIRKHEINCGGDSSSRGDAISTANINIQGQCVNNNPGGVLDILPLNTAGTPDDNSVTSIRELKFAIANYEEGIRAVNILLRQEIDDEIVSYLLTLLDTFTTELTNTQTLLTEKQTYVKQLKKHEYDDWFYGITQVYDGGPLIVGNIYQSKSICCGTGTTSSANCKYTPTGSDSIEEHNSDINIENFVAGRGLPFKMEIVGKNYTVSDFDTGSGYITPVLRNWNTGKPYCPRPARGDTRFTNKPSANPISPQVVNSQRDWFVGAAVVYINNWNGTFIDSRPPMYIRGQYYDQNWPGRTVNQLYIKPTEFANNNPYAEPGDLARSSIFSAWTINSDSTKFIWDDIQGNLSQQKYNGAMILDWSIGGGTGIQKVVFYEGLDSKGSKSDDPVISTNINDDGWTRRLQWDMQEGSTYGKEFQPLQPFLDEPCIAIPTPCVPKCTLYTEKPCPSDKCGCARLDSEEGTPSTEDNPCITCNCCKPKPDCDGCVCCPGDDCDGDDCPTSDGSECQNLQECLCKNYGLGSQVIFNLDTGCVFVVPSSFTRWCSDDTPPSDDADPCGLYDLLVGGIDDLEGCPYVGRKHDMIVDWGD